MTKTTNVHPGEQPQKQKRPRGVANWTSEQRSLAAREHAKHHPRGFAAMSPERRREIARRGGKRGHELGVAHRWTSEEAAAAGRIGGKASRRPAMHEPGPGKEAK